ncbi:hypothetical protein [endosymbiont GvMRE of Glomus versiforme]|uniref:hypothetical protein n=2 Tax=endosymbiont GvMRE of Glomus versiforme TaxID=2039283 RepID=UPI000EEE9287|nr:hypothetical protein [endosymbiont GvMRE of Glomus versiforme]RHZ37760.1 hypothetical protein GvMRE_I1g696 [endosymbiont GvMRE of Glomus versiforme]
MTIEKNAYLKALENKVVYDKTFRMLETNEDALWTRFFRQSNIEVDGRAVRFLLTWPKNGPDWKPDLSIHKGNDFKREVNAIPFHLPRLLDTVEYEITNEERFEEALESETAVKDFTKTLLEQTAENIELRLEEKIPQLICSDDNFIKWNDTTKKGNLKEMEDTFWEDPIQILKELFDGSSALKKRSKEFNKGYQKDPDDKTKGYEPMETKIRSYKRMICLLDSSVKNTIDIGGYKENVNFQALDLEKRFGSENIMEDTLPNGYGMLVFDERCLQLYRRRKNNKGFRFKEEPENGNQWFFLNPVIHGGFITAFNVLAWKKKP